MLSLFDASSYGAQKKKPTNELSGSNKTSTRNEFPESLIQLPRLSQPMNRVVDDTLG